MRKYTKELKQFSSLAVTPSQGFNNNNFGKAENTTHEQTQNTTCTG